jgi:DNA-binding Xre family transcriptional regulator
MLYRLTSVNCLKRFLTHRVPADEPVTIGAISNKVACMVRLRVKKLLREKNISMGKLSRMSDISISTIQRICNDASYSPTLNTLDRIAKALNVPLSELYEESDN